jgi:hypothetical protein
LTARRLPEKYIPSLFFQMLPIATQGIRTVRFHRMTKIRLTYPTTHTDQEIECLYNKYRTDFPDRFQEWVRIEKDFSSYGEDPLAELNRHGIEYLMENTEWETSMALFSAWHDIRKIVIRFATSH